MEVKGEIYRVILTTVGGSVAYKRKPRNDIESRCILLNSKQARHSTHIHEDTNKQRV
jgi:hypothetical protein